MKKSITPLEYKCSFGGMITGGILLSIMSIFMTIVSIFSKSDLDGDSPATFILITFVSAIICLIIGIKNNLHIRRMRSWRKHMLTMPSVEGKIIESRIVKKDILGKYKSQLNVVDATVSYILLVKYSNPYTGETYTIESDRYDKNPKYFLSNDKCKVHIDKHTSRVIVDVSNLS